MGVKTDLIGQVLEREVRRLAARTGPVDEAIAVISAGRAAGSSVDVEVGEATVSMRSIPLMNERTRSGAVLLVRDVTDLRRGERALLTKDNTIREIHHRVKNNLQTVAALLRMQGRRLSDPTARGARRIGASGQRDRARARRSRRPTRTPSSSTRSLIAWSRWCRT